MPLIQWIMNLLEKPAIRGAGGVNVSGTAQILESYYFFDGSGQINLDSLAQASFITFGGGNFRQVIQYSVGDVVYDLNGKKWQVVDFHGYGSKETQYTVRFGNSIRKYRDSELVPYIDLSLKMNCLNVLQYCVNNHETSAVAYSPGSTSFKYDVGDEVFDILGNNWSITKIVSPTITENRYECKHANLYKQFYESQLYENRVSYGLSAVHEKINRLNALQTCLNNFKARNNIQ